MMGAVRAIVAGCLLSLCTLFPSFAQPVWDEPAIKVFPIHEQIGPDKHSIEKAIADGRALFRTRFNLADGAGRPLSTGDGKPTPRLIRVSNPLQRIAGPDASACSSCHNQPRVGGSGDSATNTFVGAHFSDPPVLSVSTQVTNERNTVTVFGSGLIEILASEMTEELHAQRVAALSEAKRRGESVASGLLTKGVSFGNLVAFPDGYIDYSSVQGIDYDLVVKPFGVKGIVISLREFTINALNQHHGIQPIERFGWERTGTNDFDQDGFSNEFSIGQTTALSLFQASLPAPKSSWSKPEQKERAERRGKALFSTIGCANCHKPEMEVKSPIFSEPNKFNRPGTLTPQYTPNTIKLDLTGMLDPPVGGRFVVRAFTDLKRHNMCDDEVKFFCNEERRQDNVPVNFFITQKLWDIATSEPFCHRGDCTTLSEAILAHGGESRASREEFLNLVDDDKRAIISFLNTLGRAETSEDSP